MRINGLPNKFEIFQDFYLKVKGKEISYSEALRLYKRMDAQTQREFTQFYADEVGYVITYEKDSSGNILYDKDGNPIFDSTPITIPDGYHLHPNVVIEDTGETKNILKKAKGTTKNASETVKIYTSNLVGTNKAMLGVQYSIQAYAEGNGIILDPQWSQYSPEEIIQMENEGVNIPQDILDIAHTILESAGANGEGGEDSDNEDSTTEKEPFLDLIPKAKKNIEKCEEKREKIDDKIEEMIGEEQKNKKAFASEQEDKLKELKEYEEQVREWRHLQDKINNGEELSDSEARKYAQITGMLQEKNHNSSDFKMDKNKIALSLNEINILAVLGEQLAQETIEIADTLADYTSEDNYKTTMGQAQGEVGFLRAIVAMSQGKNLAHDANKVGNETLEYTDETSDTVRDIANVLGVEKMLSNPNSGDTVENEKPEDVEVAENEAAEGTGAGTNPAPTTDGADNAEGSKKGESAEEESEQEDFIVNDENVLALIKEVGEINVDLLKQIKTSILDFKMAKEDKSYAKHLAKFVEKMVKEYQEEEARRQDEIRTKEQENKDAQDRIDELNGGDEGKDVAEKYGVEKDENEDEGQSSEDQAEIEEKQALIDKNNQDIEALKAEAEGAKEEFKTKMQGPKSVLTEQIPEEMKALESDTAYKDQIIPEDKERIAFTDASGSTLFKMGKYRITVGLEFLAAGMLVPPLRTLGMWHISRGGISAGIGATAQLVTKVPTPKIAEKATEIAVGEEGEAVEGLNNVDGQICSVTGDQTEAEKYEAANQDDENGEEGGEGEENGEGTGAVDGQPETDGEGGVVISATAAPTTSEAQTTQEGENVIIGADGTPIVQDPANETEGDQPPAVQESEEEAATGDNAEEVLEGEEKVEEQKQPEASPSKSGSSKKDEEDMDTDKAGSIVKDAEKDGKETAKDSEKVKKDTEKDEKQLEKETQRLTKEMKNDEKAIIKMTKESLRAAKKQEELLVRYEELVTENETIAAEEEAKQASGPSQIQQAMQPQAAQGAAAGGQAAQPAQMKVNDSSQGSTAENQTKLDENNQEITVLSGQFKVYGHKIDRNSVKIKKLQKKTKKNIQKFDAKNKIRDSKIKEAAKKEEEKQKKLAKQLAIVGIQENIFSITLAIGTILAAIPWSAAVGAVMVDIGTYGVLACGVTKAVINFANGNTTAALIGLATTAVTVVASMGGAGAAAGSVMNYVSAGLSIVSSSADMANNVRTVQGKEANGTLSKISAVAGVAASVTSSASSLGNMGGMNSIGKVATVASVAGTALSGASQIMTEFGIGDEKTAQMLGTIGSAIGIAASIGQMTAKKKGDLDSKNKDSKQTTDNSQDTDTQGSQDGQKNKKADGTKDNKKKPGESTNSGNTDNNSGNTDNNGTPGNESDMTVAANGTANAQLNPSGSLTGGAASLDPSAATPEAIDQVTAVNTDSQANLDQRNDQSNQATEATANTPTEETPDAKAAKAKKKADKKAEKAEKKAAKKAEKSEKKNTIEEAKAEKKEQEGVADEIKAEDKIKAQNIVELGASEDYAHMDDNMLDDMIEGAVEIGDTDAQKKMLDERAKRQEYQKLQEQGGPEAEQAKASQKKLAKDVQEKTKQKVKNVTELGSSKEFAEYDEAQLDEMIEYYQGEGNDPEKAKAALAERDKRNEYQAKQDKAKGYKSDKREKRTEVLEKGAEVIGNGMELAAQLFSGPAAADPTKRTAGVGHLTDRSLDIRRKRRIQERRVNALSGRGNAGYRNR